jgi:MtN3 and saliva related transmembrane protein
MSWIEIVGFAAGTLTTLSFVPQVMKTARTRRCDDVSLTMLLAFTLGIALWEVYGLYLHSMPIILANAVTLGLTGAMIVMKVRFKT